MVNVPGRLWVPALESELQVAGGCLLVSLPEERSLAALAVDQLERRGLPVRIATRPPGALAARRALAGARPAAASPIPPAESRGGSSAWGVGGEPSGRQRARRGQALPALLGAGLILILAAVVLAAIGGAATGRGRVQRAADLAALSAVRSMRDDMPRLLAPAPASRRRPEPATPLPRRVPRPRPPRRGRCRQAKPRRSRPRADRVSRRCRQPAAARPRHRRRGDRPGAAAGRRAPRGPRSDPRWSRAPSPRPPLR